MHLFHLLDPVAGSGGELFGKEKVVLSLLERQRRLPGVTPHLVSFVPSPLDGPVADLGVATHHLSQRRAGMRPGPLLRLRRLLADHPPAVVHSHGYKANLFARLLRLTGPRLRLVGTCHGFVDNDRRLRLYNVLDRRTARLHDAVTVPDPAMKDRFPASAPVLWLPNGIADRPTTTPDQRRDSRTHFGWADDRFVVGMLGRLSPEKGPVQFRLAAAADDVPDTLWTCAGSGPLRERLSADPPANWQACGFVDGDRYVAGLDAYVQPSLREGLSLALLEAARAGVPVVATRVGATADCLRHEREALLVDPDRPAEILAAVARLREHPSLRDRLRTAARRRFEEAFRLDTVVERLDRLYRPTT